MKGQGVGWVQNGDFAGFQNRTSEQFSEVTVLGFGRRAQPSALTVYICRAVKEARQTDSITADQIVHLYKVCSCLS